MNCDRVLNSDWGLGYKGLGFRVNPPKFDTDRMYGFGYITIRSPYIPYFIYLRGIISDSRKVVSTIARISPSL